MADKMLPCCARFQTTLACEEAELRRVIAMANVRVEKGLSIVKEQARMAELKTGIQTVKQNIVNHEAEHCDGSDCRKSHWELKA